MEFGDQTTALHDGSGESPEGHLLAGKYRLMNPIGEGGMGTVWLAEQREPVKRSVAVKLIKHGMDSKAVIARFEAERQALALMDHPNIAKILDGGLSETGAPFFVMELVKGEPLTQFCDSRKLSLVDRLKLFVPVCNAIQHAHQKGVIHRDIKPSNILVATYDDVPVPKIIDFGVAKATGPALTEHTLNTGMSVVGTPQYMSPEQASLNPLDIDTRSDVYSLGIVLYELLTGAPPFGSEELKKAGYLEILRIIREEEPSKPSTKVSHAESLPEIAKARQMEPHKLSGMLRSELDWIVMKALEKDRTRRYETASSFATDIERYLHGDGVEAHPPSSIYRLRKFARKNRGLVVTVSGILLALLLGFAGTAMGLWEANRQRVIAVRKQAEAETAKQKAEQAEEEAIEAYRASTDDAIQDLLGSKDSLSENEKAYLTKLSERWQAFADRQGNDDRALAISTEGLYRVGLMYSYLGDHRWVDLTEKALVAATDLTKRNPNNPKYLYLESLVRLQLGERNGMRDQAALPLFEAAIAMLERVSEMEPDNEAVHQALCKSHLRFANTHSLLDQVPAAEAACQRAVMIQSKALERFPGSPEITYFLSQTLGIQAGLPSTRGEKASELAIRSIRLMEDVCKRYPHVWRYQYDLSEGFMFFALLSNKRETFKTEVDKLYHGRAGFDIAHALAAKYPSNIDVVSLHAARSQDMGLLLNHRGQTVEAGRLLQNAVEMKYKQEILRKNEGVMDGGLPLMERNLLDNLLMNHKWAEAANLAGKLTERCFALLLKYPDYRFNYQKLVPAVHGSTTAYFYLRDYESADLAFIKRVAQSHVLVEKVPSLECLDFLLFMHRDYAQFLLKTGRLQDYLSSFEPIDALIEQLYPKLPNSGSVIQKVFLHYTGYAASLRECGQLDVALQWLDKAANLSSQLPRGPVQGLQKILRMEVDAQRAAVFTQQRDYPKALACWDRVLADDQVKTIWVQSRAIIRAYVGQIDEAIQDIEKAKPTQWVDFYNLACVYAVASNSSESDALRTKSLEAIGRAIALGFRDAKHLREDIDLHGITELPEYQHLLGLLTSLADGRDAVERQATGEAQTHYRQAYEKAVGLFGQESQPAEWVRVLQEESMVGLWACLRGKANDGDRNAMLQEHIRFLRKQGTTDPGQPLWRIGFCRWMILYSRSLIASGKGSEGLRLLEKARVPLEPPFDTTGFEREVEEILTMYFEARSEGLGDNGEWGKAVEDLKTAESHASADKRPDLQAKRLIALVKAGRWDEAMTLYEMLGDLPKRSAICNFHLACFCNQAGTQFPEQAQAFSDLTWFFLSKATKSGLITTEMIATNPALSDLHDHPEMQMILYRIKNPAVPKFGMYLNFEND